MAKSITIKTPLAEAYIKDGIIYNHYANVETTVEMATEHVRMVREHFGEQLPLPCVAYLESTKTASKEVREYFATDEATSLYTSIAIVAPSGLARIVANIFLKFTKMNNPTKMFKNEEKALEWLQQQTA